MLELGDELLIGFKSGKYFGRKKSRAPAVWMARRTVLPLCEARLSVTDDVAGPQCRDRDLLDIGLEGFCHSCGAFIVPRVTRAPRLNILPKIVRSPVEICFGTSPS